MEKLHTKRKNKSSGFCGIAGRDLNKESQVPHTLSGKFRLSPSFPTTHPGAHLDTQNHQAGQPELNFERQIETESLQDSEASSLGRD